MLLRTGKRIISWWTKSALGRNHAINNVEDVSSIQLPGHGHSKSPNTIRRMAAKDVVFRLDNTYKKKPTERQRIINKVLGKAIPGAVGAVVINAWHTSPSEKRVHCTVDYTDAHNRRLIRKHIFRTKTKKK
ncbi:hypothetical protein FVEN_g11726 [Fusarium venenatum]|uniref:Uncharacterized protein n=1 Tax=Fusarium venenatum TaxID=56646 RepID=A0A2L2T3R2_9HYPO|nr:uncharacterized protein FVRRES_11149 [Fusarium venenatum]KAG8350143.1 hypothetical protein FVEN_g11726 [Fusarium venenatum]KAH6977874.1 hypothetical protein EDB82DRAFT_525968 [Fusarium venenatum]CEI38458.1 unnamed protein product [Fusarium venenatum]